MAWEKVKLGDVSESCLGKMLDQQKNRGEFHPYLANVNVRWGSFDLEDLPLMKFEDSEQERYGLKYGDLVVCEGGEPGRCAIWKNQIPNMKIQKALHRVRVSSDMDYRYLFYWFLYAGKRGALDQYFTGATIKHMPGEKLKQVLIDKPPLKEQKRIADILSAYDNLIENNQKQIKLLEEAAQRLYKQWFIDLRFPGHETTPIVNGLPKGWRKEKLVEIIDCEIGGGWGEDDIKEKCDQPAFVIRGTDFYGITHGEILNIPFRYHSKTNLDARALCDGDIIFEVSGGSKTEGVAKTVLIKQALLDHLKYPVMCASFCKLIRLKNRKLSQYMYDAFFYLRKSGKTAEYDKRSASSIVNYRWKDFLNEVDILIPPNNIIEIYNGIASSAYERIINFSLSIETAKKTRDRLLPKLMNGELEV